MFKGETLRVLVNARLTAAAEEIFALFERTTAEFEEELRRSKEENQRKQELLDSVLSQGLNHQGLNHQGLHHQGLNHQDLHHQDLHHQDLHHQDLNHQDLNHQGLDLGLDQETPWIKEEPERPCIRSSSVCVKREESSLLQQSEHGEEPRGEELRGEEPLGEELRGEEPRGEEPRGEETRLHPLTEGEPSDTDNDEDWSAPFSCSGAQVKTEADGSSCAPNKHRSEAETMSITANARDTPERAAQTRHKCLICKKTFGTKHNLKIHTKLHTGERPFSCTICGKAFVVGSKLRLHMRTHTGERPFSCSACGKTYMQKVHLDAHTRTHTGDRPFSCTVCGKAFKQHYHLKAHLKTHWEKDLSAWPQERVQDLIQANVIDNLLFLRRDFK